MYENSFKKNQPIIIGILHDYATLEKKPSLLAKEYLSNHEKNNYIININNYKAQFYLENLYNYHTQSTNVQDKQPFEWEVAFCASLYHNFQYIHHLLIHYFKPDVEVKFLIFLNEIYKISDSLKISKGFGYSFIDFENNRIGSLERFNQHICETLIFYCIKELFTTESNEFVIERINFFLYESRKINVYRHFKSHNQSEIFSYLDSYEFPLHYFQNLKDLIDGRLIIYSKAQKAKYLKSQFVNPSEINDLSPNNSSITKLNFSNIMNINQEIITCLKPYIINEKDLSNLESYLKNGYNIMKPKIDFNLTGSTLLNFFKQLHQKEIILDEIAHLNKFISYSFKVKGKNLKEKSNKKYLDGTIVGNISDCNNRNKLKSSTAIIPRKIIDTSHINLVVK